MRGLSTGQCRIIRAGILNPLKTELLDPLLVETPVKRILRHAFVVVLQVANNWKGLKNIRHVVTDNDDDDDHCSSVFCRRCYRTTQFIDDSSVARAVPVTIPQPDTLPCVYTRLTMQCALCSHPVNDFAKHARRDSERHRFTGADSVQDF